MCSVLILEGDMYLLRYVRGFIGLTLSAINLIFNKVVLFSETVSSGNNITIYGRLFIRNYGKITLEDNVKIISSFAKNPILNSSFTSIVTEQNAEIFIGSNTGISNSFFYSVDSIIIGRRVLIGAGCKIYDTDFHSIYAKNRLVDEDKGISKPVIIGDDVFIGASSIVLKGSKIGEACVIGANSVVSGNIPANQIWAGNPAKFISHITQN